MVGAVVNDLIAAGGAWLTDAEGQSVRIDRTKEYLILNLLGDLENSISVYQQLRQQWAEHEQIDITTLGDLKKVYSILGSNSAWMHEFIGISLLDDIEAYYQEASNSIEKITVLNLQVNSIEHGFKLLVKSIRKSQPQLTLSEALDQVESMREGESSDYRRMLKQLEGLVGKLSDLEVRAAELRTLLVNSQKEVA